MMVRVDIEVLMPDLYLGLLFEPKDSLTLSYVRAAYGREFKGDVVRWTSPNGGGCVVDVEFGSDDEAMLFVLRYL